MLADIGCDYCIVGHSERREMFGETDETVNKKVKALLAGGITPSCAAARRSRRATPARPTRFVRGQIRGALEGSPPRRPPAS